MITDLTQVIVALRSKMSKAKRALKQHILDFVFLSSCAGTCILCDKPMHMELADSPRKGEVGCCNTHPEQLEEKLCKMCIVRTHSDSVIFPLRLDFPDQFKEYQKFFEYLGLLQCGGPGVRGLDSIRPLCAEDLEKLYTEMKLENKDTLSIPETLGSSKFTGKVAESFRTKIKRDRIKLFKLRQIKYKLSVIAEQIELVQRNHGSAIESGRLEDAEKFRELFCDLWCAKIDLEERLVRSGGHPQSGEP